MTEKPAAKMNEGDVVALWRQVSSRRNLVDSEGGRIEVIYPGRPNDSRGADFRDAVITSHNEPKQGCIEVHTLASNWQTHGHHRDPVYNQVVLHVALKRDKISQTILQNGQAVPTVILEKSLSQRQSRAISGSGLPCSGVIRKKGLESLVNSLEQAGDQRFAEKVARYRSGWSQMEAEQILYQGLLEALGYSQNKLPFLELAHRVPLRHLATLIQSNDPEPEYFRLLPAFLLGHAGLLPSQRAGFIMPQSNVYIEDLEKAWRTFPREKGLDYRRWELFKVRPENHPVRRLMALVGLLYRYQKTGLLQALLGLVRDIPPELSPASLVLALVVSAQGYWKGHYDFGCPTGAFNPVLLGQARAAEILVNVIFPFAFCWSQMAPEPGIDNKALDLYHRYPRLETNSIERHMLQQLDFNRQTLNTACRQQGLLHIYKTLCIQGKCEECKLRF